MLRVIPWKTEILEDLTNQTVELNSKAEFKCAVSLPNISLDEVSWYFNDEKVSLDDERFTYNVEDEYIHAFSLLRAEEGDINARVRFETRDVKSEAELLVYIPPRKVENLTTTLAEIDIPYAAGWSRCRPFNFNESFSYFY